MNIINELRDQLIVALDDYLENVNDDPGAGQLAEKIVSLLEITAEELGMDDAGSIIADIEEAAGLEEDLVDVLETELGRTNDLELDGESIVEFIEKLGMLDFDETDDDDDFDEDDDSDEVDDIDEEEEEFDYEEDE